MAPRPQGSHLTIVLVFATAAFAASALLSGMLRRYALTHSLLDVPNERSLHSIPTPRGAGLTIVLVFLGGLAALWALGLTPTRLFLALAGGAAMVAAAGWWDDGEGMPAGVRLAVHAAAAVWALVWLGGMPALTVGMGAVWLGAGGAVLAAVAVVWSVNLYNVPDGVEHWLVRDLTDHVALRQALAGVEAVVHLAAHVHQRSVPADDAAAAA